MTKDILKEMKYNNILREVCCNYISQEQYYKIKDLYSQKTRHWHNWTHIVNVADSVYCGEMLTERERNIMLIAAFLHDAVYDTQSKTNEEDSAKLVEQFNIADEEKKFVSDLILFTKYQRTPENRFETMFMEADLEIFTMSPSEQLVFEKAIFQEYYWVPIPYYVSGRIQILKMLHEQYGCETQFLINYLESKTWNVGYYVGTFFPGHSGHNSICEQAKPMFDKLIIGFGKPSEKTSFQWNTEAFGTLNEWMIDKYETNELKPLVTQNIAELRKYANVTVIRGLRNGTDLIMEQNYLQSVRDFMPDVKFAYFMTEPQLAHVSSSLIRDILKHSPKDAYKYYKL